ncbi:hypothetical protein JOC77_002877 [Peribacillus deserti]|uniref:DUF1189 domain-containing protein n=1 Tax=Peribacillus deserti TaxID=673318 RepID=A0ABS2QJT5_9BACI|nr:DUF1189 family protein [Peribacillus deserti]MBM7693437.1 hypothetical protein [Peribacillus deserti]
MGIFKSFALNRISLKIIAGFGKKKLIHIILQNILIGTLIAFPLVVQISKSDESKLSKASFPVLEKEETWFKTVNDLKVIDGKLVSPHTAQELKRGNEHIAVDPQNKYRMKDNSHSYIVFSEQILYIKAYGIQLRIPYSESSLTTFGAAEFKGGGEFLAAIAAAATPYLLIPAMQFIYPLSILLNFIFIAIVSLFALPMNYRSRKKAGYRQLFTMFSYAATMPAILAFVFGSLASAAFVYTIYNFGLILTVYLLFKRYLR